MKQNLEEAQRCISCKVPLCEKGCPVNTEIRDIIKLYKECKAEGRSDEEILDYVEYLIQAGQHILL